MAGPAAHDGARPAVLAEGVSKRFGHVQALDGVSLEVPEGSVLALLGPNGAGKTTLVRILTTLLGPDEGRVEIGGLDTVRDRRQVRTMIGLSGQFAAVDDRLTARENLELVARLYHLSPDETRARVTELLERFDLVGPADRPSYTYSGGMRRRLDLAASMVSSPKVLFLDEPSVGLDPTGRIQLWSVIEDLVEDGITVLVTTQYLEEADRLADRIAVIDSGRVIAQGTPSELKGAAGHWFIEIIVADRDQTQAGADTIAMVISAEAGPARVHHHSGRIRVPVGEGAVPLDDLTRHLETAGIAIAELALRQPTLDDVFAVLTGAEPEQADETETPAAGESGPGGSA
jgi:ABC-2 type transport system ATP-binding protein